MTALVTSVAVEQPPRTDVRALLQRARTAISCAGTVTDQAGARANPGRQSESGQVVGNLVLVAPELLEARQMA
jgi:hypothetical protein